MSTRLQGLGLTYAVDGRRLVDGVDVEVAAGQVVALAGPNGAGKSTLLRLLSGELRPASGTVSLDGRPLPELSQTERARLRAVMPQETVLQFAFTVREVVEMGRFPHRGSTASADADWAAVTAALRSAELEPLAPRTFPTLSGGERGRTTLARVLAQEAPILLLDEPVGALDLRHQVRAMEAARDAARAGGAVLAALHDLNLAAAYADQVVLLHGGRVAGAGTPWEVLRADLLEEVFDHPVVVARSPCADAPLVVPAPARPG